MPSTDSTHLDTTALQAQRNSADPRVLQRFFVEIYPLVRHASARTIDRFPSKQRAVGVEDLAQTACAKVLEGLVTFDVTKGRFSTWVWTIVRRSWFDVLSLRQGDLEVDLDDTVDDTASAFSPVDEQVDARIGLGTLGRMLPRVSFELLVTNAMGSSAQEIGSTQGVSFETVKSRLRVARHRAIAVVGSSAVAA